MFRSVSKHNSVKGFSLVELLVATLLGLIVSLGVGRAFIGSKEGFTLIQSSSLMQENGRFSMGFIRESVQLAGFKPAGSLSEYVFPVDSIPSGGNWQASQVIAGTSGSAAGQDTMTVRYFGYSDAYVRDCVGGTVAATGYITQHFYVDATNNALMCRINTGAPQVIVEGVERFRVSYGVDDDLDGATDMYLSADDVQASSLWDRVKVVKVYLIARDLDPINTLEYSRTFTLGDQTVTFDDNFVRDMFFTTIELKNRVQR